MSAADCSFKALAVAGASQLLQNQCSLTFRLLKTVADFSQALANLHDKFGHELQVLVENFRKRNGELRKERSLLPASLVQIWELLLQQVEVNSQHHGDISRSLSQTVGSGLIEQVFQRKIQSKKVFAHWDRIEAILSKSSELLHKCHADYSQAYAAALANPAQCTGDYISAHNVYVHQLQATNGMIHAYQTRALPRLLEELEECHLETSQSVSRGLLEASELVSEKSNEQLAGHQVIASACRQANARADLAQLVRALEAQDRRERPGEQPATGDQVASLRYHQFQGPEVGRSNSPAGAANCSLPPVPTFKNEIAPNPSQPPSQQRPQLEKERSAIEERLEQLEGRAEALGKALARAADARLHNRTNELREELSQCRFELLTAHLHLSAVRSQLQLFEYNFRPGAAGPTGELTGSGPAAAAAAPTSSSSSAACDIGDGAAGLEQAPHPHLVAAATAGYRNKWIKALKSLKSTEPVVAAQTPSAAAAAALSTKPLLQPNDGSELTAAAAALNQAQTSGQLQAASAAPVEKQHCFQEYTFKKIASCDVCKEFLRGHLRQGVKCKLCKTSCHNECQPKAHATIRCQQPKMKLLRRQKSAGELELNTSDGAPDNSEASSTATERSNLGSSKPDSLYQLFKQVLEAKKRGDRTTEERQQQQAVQNQQLGSLSLANQNGKSVSTSALGAAASGGVDRWAVVMELLAQSRAKGEREPEPASSRQRHSKQLDKFKSAAKTAAAASRSQRHHLPATSAESHALSHHQSVAPPPPEVAAEQQVGSARGQSHPLPPAAATTHQQLHHQQQPLHATNSSPLSHQPLTAAASQALHLGASRQLPAEPTKYLLAATSGGATTHLQHTQSLPMDQQQAQQQLQQQQHLQLQQPAGWLDMGEQVQAQAPAPPPLAYPQHQLLGINSTAQQSQSTSAPHSPQRKRFNLRMKSFSLDSPESPCLPGSSGRRPADSPTSGSPPTDSQHFYGHRQQQQQYQGYQPSVAIYAPAQYLQQQEAAAAAAAEYRKQSLGAGEQPNSGMFYAPTHRHSYQHAYQHLETGPPPLQSAASAHQLDRAEQVRKHAASGSKQAHEYYNLRGEPPGSGAQVAPPPPPPTSAPTSSNTFAVLYDYLAQRADEIQLSAGQVVCLLDASERDWWEVRALDGSQRCGFFPAAYLAELYPNERPLQVAQTIQVSTRDTCEKLLRGQIVIHAGKQGDKFVTIRLVKMPGVSCYMQCPEKYLLEVEDAAG